MVYVCPHDEVDEEIVVMVVDDKMRGLLFLNALVSSNILLTAAHYHLPNLLVFKCATHWSVSTLSRKKFI